MNQLIVSVFLFWCLLFSPVNAQSEFPEYDGVYIFDYENDRWIELSRQRLLRTGVIASPGDDRDVLNLFPSVPQAWGRTSVVHGVLAADIDSAPKLSDGRLKIFVRSPDLKLSFVEIAVSLGDLQGTVNRRPQPQNVMNDSSPDVAGRLKPFAGEPAPDYAMVRLGWNPDDHFQVRTIDQFSAVYELKQRIVENQTVRGYSSGDCRVDCVAHAAAYFIHVVNPMRPGRSGYDLPGNHYLFSIGSGPRSVEPPQGASREAPQDLFVDREVIDEMARKFYNGECEFSCTLSDGTNAEFTGRSAAVGTVFHLSHRLHCGSAGCGETLILLETEVLRLVANGRELDRDFLTRRALENSEARTAMQLLSEAR